jgi:hypothetical protein
MYSLGAPGALNGLHSVAFLGHLLRLAGERLVVIWERHLFQPFFAGAGLEL